jgi:hypothetical protein
MSTRRSVLSLLALLVAMSILSIAQAPTGTITGTVADESGAIVPNVTVTITNKATGIARTVVTNSEGYFSAPALQAGEYEVRAEFKGFKATVRPATVQTGESTQVNMPMSIGATGDTITVEAATSQINYESHNIQGVIPRSTIQDLPLNGRSYLQLAQLEPGVVVSSGTVAQFNVLFTVSVLGAGNRTAVTIDGGNVSDNIDVGGGMSSMNFSQETVQEFQLSEVNFDLATPIAAGGAINVVTRSGSNDFHGSGYFFFRDHNMAAYPGLQRLAVAPASPFFVRRNPGFSIGGPIIKDKLFFFFNYEYLNQVQAVAVTTTSPYLAALQGSYGSPYSSKQISGRLDYHLNEKHTMFLRYSHDGNSGFGQSLEFGDPSNWPHNTNWADQGIIGITSLLSPRLVNDLRFQYNYWNNHNDQAVASDCSSPCIAGSLPNIFTFLGSNLPAVGPNFNAPQARNTRRFELVETLSWQRGNHRFKFGGDLNPTNSAGLWGFCTPQCTGAFSPDYLANAFGGAAVAASIFGAAAFNIKTDKDVLNLPVLNIGSSIFSGVGVGSVPLPGAYNYDENRHYDQYRAFFQDVWKIRPNFTFNYGLAWNAQTGFYNSSLPRPSYLAPILGSGNLGGTQNNTKEFQPAFGFAWSPFKNNKTVIRGGAGIYWDSTPGYYKLREAASIGPPGSARSTLAGSAFTNNIPGPFGGSGLINFAGPGPCPIPGFPASACSVVPFGAPLPLSGLTTMTVGQFTNLVQQELPAIAAILAPPNPPRSGPFPYPNINYAKQGVEIYPQNFPLARSYQTSIGVQHDLGHGTVINADWARRQGENVSLGEVDQNLFTRYQGSTTPVPVIPLCQTNPDFDPTHNCSSGSITFWTDQGRAVYNGLLVKVQKRMANHFQYLVSYAWQKATTQTVWDNTNYAAGTGEYLPHHNLTVAGTATLPWHFTLSLNSSFISRTPITPQVNGLILPGTVPSGSSEPLPGLQYGSINAGAGKDELAAAVAAYNSNIVGTKNAQGSTIASPLALPSDYQFGDPTITQDFRLTWTYPYKEKYKFNILAEMFNAFNISNLTGYSFTLDSKNANAAAQTFAFGQPTQRVNQTFGSAGPRALQVGARFTF